MKPRLKEDPREWRKFGLTLTAPLTVLTLLLCWRRTLPWSATPWAAVVIAAVALAAVVRPRWFRWPYRGGTTVGFYVGQGVGRVALLIVYVFGLVPMGLLLRLLGKDLLGLRRWPEAPTYWRPARPSGPLDRMF